MSLESVIESYKNNEVIMSEVTKEAVIKTASELKCSIEEAESLTSTHNSVKNLVDSYTAIGLMAVFIAFKGQPAK